MKKTKAKTKAVTVVDSDKEERELEEAGVAVLDAKEKLDPAKLPNPMKKEMYELWLSIPAMLRLLPDSELKKMGYETENPVFMRLVRIDSKREFARQFGIGVNTPAFWEQKEPQMVSRAMEMARQQHALKFQKEVDFSFTQKVLKHGDAHRVKLWKQLFEGWSEKIEHRNTNVNLDVVGLVQMIEKRNAEIRAKP